MITTPDTARGSDTGALFRAALCLALDSLAIEASGLLAAAGVPSLLLKGPVTAACLYGDHPELRSYSDVDLLVAPAQFAVAENVLRAAGFRPAWAGLRDSEMPWHERPWRAPERDLVVDLHRGFGGVNDPDAFWAALGKDATTLELAGSPISVPGIVGTALLVALHAGTPGQSDKPLKDLMQARDLYGLAVWEEMAGLARQVDADAACRAGLELLPQGAELARLIGLSRPVPLTHWLQARRTSNISVSFATAFHQRTVIEFAGYARRKLLPTPAFLRLHDSRARRGVRGLAVAYLGRWARVGLGTFQAVAELDRARRSIVERQPHRDRRLRQMKSAVQIALSPGAIRTLAWAAATLGRVRRELKERPLDEIDFAAPPAVDPTARRAMTGILRLRHATCLEQALLSQRFDAAGGRGRALIVAVTAPSEGFRAHSWLEGESQPDSSLEEIVRRPPPPHWLTSTPMTRSAHR